MADKGIIFSAPMVRALLDGRKTQTRRIIKMYGRRPEYCGPSGCKSDPTCWGWEDGDNGGWVTLEKEPGDRMGWLDWVGAPRAGDRLYVREAFQLLRFGDYAPTKAKPADVRFAATDTLADLSPDDRGYPWRPSIHMPRWASRLWLEVTEVRVQRVQEISLGDICAEGLASSIYDFKPVMQGFRAWEELWSSLHTKPGETWQDNPWIVAVSFDVHQGNIDAEQAA